MIETTRGTPKAVYLHVWHLAGSVSRKKETPENNVMEISNMRNKQ
jgi:hypothetical protein